MDNPKISVIIPVYNAGKYIRQCLESILNQTMKEIEVLCVDDGSTDKSKNIIKNFSKKDHRITYLTMTKNSGSGLARNKGIENAKGEYISFVDSDDHIINNTAYEEIYKFAHQNNANMVTTNLRAFINDGEYFQNKKCPEVNKELPILPQDYGVPWYHQKNLYNRNFLIENNIKYPDYKRGQDPVFLAKVLKNVDLVYCLPVDFYGYRTFETFDKLNSEGKELDYIKHFRDVLDILDLNTFKETHLKYEKKMYDFFTTPILYFSTESLEKNIKTVFGENSKIFTIYKLENSLFNKEKEIIRLKSTTQNKEKSKFIISNEMEHFIDSIILLKEENNNLQINGKNLNFPIKYLIEEFYEILFLENRGRSISQILSSKFPRLYILFNRNASNLKGIFLNIKGYKAIKDNKFFDIGYYLKKYPDIRKSGKDPLLHYMLYGFKEGRNPNTTFDNDYYLSENPDVKDLNISPLVHHSIFGHKEHRKINANQELKVIRVNQVNNSNMQSIIEVTFNQPIKAGTKWIEFKNNIKQSIPIEIEFFRNRIYITCLESLSKSIPYTLILHSACITDIYNRPITLYTYSFLKNNK